MKWMRWVVLGVLLIHAPLACTVWDAYRLADALATPTESRQIELPFATAQGQILDFYPSDPKGAFSQAQKVGDQFLVYPVLSNLDLSGMPNDRPTDADSQQLNPDPTEVSYEMVWLGRDAVEDQQGALELLDIEPDTWKPVSAFSPEPVRGQLAWTVVNPSQALDQMGIWRWVEQFYLSWTYPRLRLALAPSNLAPRLKVWTDAQVVRQVRASAVSACGETLLKPCLQYVSTFVQLGEAETKPRTVLEGLAKGATFVAFPPLGNPTFFSFHAQYEGRAYRMGSQVPQGAELVFQTDRPALFQIFRSGTLLQELEGVRFSFPAEEPGEYRVLVQRPDAPVPEERPWIISSPIYVGSP